MKTVKGSLATGLTVLMAAFALVGCGKNSDNGQPAAVANPYGPGVYGQCAGCIGNTQPIAQNVTAQSAPQSGLGEGIQLSIFGTAGMTYQSAYNSGYAQVAAQGTLHIGQFAQGCGLPFGDYQITTNGAPAVMNGYRINGLQMTGVGPTQVTMQFDYVYLLNAQTVQVKGRMWGLTPMQPCDFTYQ